MMHSMLDDVYCPPLIHLQMHIESCRLVVGYAETFWHDESLCRNFFTEPDGPCGLCVSVSSVLFQVFPYIRCTVMCKPHVLVLAHSLALHVGA